MDSVARVVRRQVVRRQARLPQGAKLQARCRAPSEDVEARQVGAQLTRAVLRALLRLAPHPSRGLLDALSSNSQVRRDARRWELPRGLPQERVTLHPVLQR